MSAPNRFQFRSYHSILYSRGVQIDELLRLTARGNLENSHVLRNTTLTIEWVLICVHQSTVSQFQLVMSLIALQNLLNHRARATSRVLIVLIDIFVK
jgi:hypothetical protein